MLMVLVLLLSVLTVSAVAAGTVSTVELLPDTLTSVEQLADHGVTRADPADPGKTQGADVELLSAVKRTNVLKLSGVRPTIRIACDSVDKTVSFDFKYSGTLGSNQELYGLYYSLYRKNGDTPTQGICGSLMPNYKDREIDITTYLPNYAYKGASAVFLAETWYHCELSLNGSTVSVSVSDGVSTYTNTYTISGYTPNDGEDCDVVFRWLPNNVAAAGNAVLFMDDLCVKADGATTEVTPDTAADLAAMTGLAVENPANGIDPSVELLASIPERTNVLKLSGMRPTLKIACDQVEKKITYDFMFQGTIDINYGLYTFLYRENTSEFNGLGGMVGKTQLMTNLYDAASVRQKTTAMNLRENVWYTCELHLTETTMSMRVSDGSTEYTVSHDILDTYTVSNAQDCDVMLRWLPRATYAETNARLFIDDLCIETTDAAKLVAISAASSDTALGTATVSGVNGEGKAAYGETVTLKATPAAGCQFDGWYLNGDLKSFSLNHTVTASEDAAYTAKFSAEPSHIYFFDDYEQYDTGALDHEKLSAKYMRFESNDQISEANFSIGAEEKNKYLLSATKTKVFLDCPLIEKQLSFDFLYEGDFKSYGGIYAALLDAPNTAGGTNKQYFSFLPDYGDQNLDIVATVDGVETHASTKLTNLQKNTWFSCKSRMYGNAVYVKLWVKSDPEPAEWTAVVPASKAVASAADGCVYFSLTNLTNPSINVRVDNVSIKTWEETHVRDEYQVKVSANDGAMGTV